MLYEGLCSVRLFYSLMIMNILCLNLCLESKEIQVIHDLMTQRGSKIMPDNWVCVYVGLLEI